MLTWRTADAPLRLITKADIKGFVAARREEVRQKTVAKDLAALSQAFADAVDSEVIDRNPCAGVSIPPGPRGREAAQGSVHHGRDSLHD